MSEMRVDKNVRNMLVNHVNMTLLKSVAINWTYTNYAGHISMFLVFYISYSTDTLTQYSWMYYTHCLKWHYAISKFWNSCSYTIGYQIYVQT